MYQACYDLINQYIYNNSVVLGSYQDLVCITFSTIATLFLVALPFIIVWRIIRLWF